MDATRAPQAVNEQFGAENEPPRDARKKRRVTPNATRPLGMILAAIHPSHNHAQRTKRLVTKNATRPLGMILAAALPSRNAAQRTKRRVIENKFVSVAQLRGIVKKRFDECA